MIESDFFTEVEHSMVPWLGYHLHVPVFYFDTRYMSATFLSPIDKVRSMLPSKRLHPFGVMPGRAAVTISAYQYRESDLGPYNEVSIGIPVSLDKPTRLFTGSLRKVPSPVMIYVYSLPVTTEIARKVGVDFVGYPKYIAQIEFKEDEDWLSCTLALEGELIFTLKGRKLAGRPVSRTRINPLTGRKGYILRSEVVTCEREEGSSRRKGDALLTLGDHPLAEQLKMLGLQTPSRYSYCPRSQSILTPVFESFAA
ncbi:MAG: acetoacetate decarboxylase family protein [Anaerolineales bacterium]|nr:acetoacetate decarboxylase family protein [Anaerolineales bacterium]